jgi:hypothetical protein
MAGVWVGEGQEFTDGRRCDIRWSIKGNEIELTMALAYKAFRILVMKNPGVPKLRSSL